MAYKVEFTPPARKQFKKLPEEVKERIGAKLQALASDPRPPGSKKLVNRHGIWRIRAGDYRAIYCIEDKVLIVLVVEVGHRSDVYD